jgi:hypothetical protein
MTIGRASYEPGWKWSEHVGAATGAALCEVEHVGMVVSGCAACRMQDGRYHEMRAGDLFYVGPGHDSWAVGNEPYVSLHFLGAERYASHTANTIREMTLNLTYRVSWAPVLPLADHRKFYFRFRLP